MRMPNPSNKAHDENSAELNVAGFVANALAYSSVLNILIKVIDWS